MSASNRSKSSSTDTTADATLLKAVDSRIKSLQDALYSPHQSNSASLRSHPPNASNPLLSTTSRYSEGRLSNTSVPSRANSRSSSNQSSADFDYDVQEGALPSTDRRGTYRAHQSYDSGLSDYVSANTLHHRRRKHTRRAKGSEWSRTLNKMLNLLAPIAGEVTYISNPSKPCDLEDSPFSTWVQLLCDHKIGDLAVRDLDLIGTHASKLRELRAKLKASMEQDDLQRLNGVIGHVEDFHERVKAGYGQATAGAPGPKKAALHGSC